jgi:hypothetical protein
LACAQPGLNLGDAAAVARMVAPAGRPSVHRARRRADRVGNVPRLSRAVDATGHCCGAKAGFSGVSHPVRSFGVAVSLRLLVARPGRAVEAATTSKTDP